MTNRPPDTDAVHFDGSHESVLAVMHLVDAGHATTEIDIHADEDPTKTHITIPTPDGPVRVSAGDWIARETDGTFRAHGPCPAGLMPVGDGPVEKCVERPPHDTHRTAAGETWTDDTFSAEDQAPAEEQPAEAYPAEVTFRIETHDVGAWLPIGYPRPTLDEARQVRDGRRAKTPGARFRIVEWTASARVIETDEVPASAEAVTA